MKHIIICSTLCLISYNAYGMKRPPQNNPLDLAVPTDAGIEPAHKKIKLASPEEQQNRIIVKHLNNALLHLGNAQEAVKKSNNELELRISQMHREVAHASSYVQLLNKYQSNINKNFDKMRRTHDYLTHYLENTKEDVVDTTVSIAFNNQAHNRLTQLLPDSISKLIDAEKFDEIIIEDSVVQVEAEEASTTVVAPQKQKRPAYNIHVER